MMAVSFTIFLICWFPWWTMFMVFPFHLEAAKWFEGNHGTLTPYNFITWLGETHCHWGLSCHSYSFQLTAIPVWSPLCTFA